uniref:PB1 domain-containing protein n=1 Tax=Astyanax mexicanus TaxID=7994 RepID=A0A8B9K3T5_ASTMX
MSNMADIAPVRLLVILNNDNSVRMELHNGVPDSVDELIEEVKRFCGLGRYVRLQYKDTDFGNIFVNMTSTAVVKDLSVIKVVELDPDSATVVLYPVDDTGGSLLSDTLDNEDNSPGSAHSDDTVLCSNSPDTLRTQQWPKVFPIPLFSFDTESQLKRGNAEYMKSQSRLMPGSKMLSDILERLAEKMYMYKAYPTDADFSDVAEALTKTHPCLREPGSFNESYGWKQRLKVKMANYRTLLKARGTTAELTVNSLKSKSLEEAYPAKGLKRPRRAEVNHFPTLPSGETPESMEKERISLLTELQKRNNRQSVKEKMVKTFGYRRQEIVHKMPSIEDVMERWPALFQMEEVC